MNEFGGVEIGVAVGQTVDHAEVAIETPAVKGRIEAALGVGAVAQVPPDEAVEFGLHELGEAVGIVEGVDEDHGLFALVAGVAVVFGDDEFDVAAAGAEVVTDLLAQVRGVAAPGG